MVDLPDLLLIDGGVAQLAAAARALADAGVVVVNARAPRSAARRSIAREEALAFVLLARERADCLLGHRAGQGTRLSGEEAVGGPPCFLDGGDFG